MSEGLQLFLAAAIGCVHAIATLELLDRVRPWLKPLVVVAAYAVLIGILFAFAWVTK